MSNPKLIRKQLNASRGRGLRGEERANAAACLALSDALREVGERLADLWRAVGELLPAWQDNWRALGFAERVTYASDRAKFIALDYGDEGSTGGSGCFLVEKETGRVWSIRGYGKKNRVVAAHPDELADAYRQGAAGRG